jgi:hypothetical protein
MPASTAAPKVNLFDGTGIADGGAIGRLEGAGEPDAISEAVGRPGYLYPYEVAVDDRDEVFVFERYYFPTDDAKAVYVDTVSGGIEREHREAEKQVAIKRRWCKKRGLTYMVVVEDTVTV